MCRYSALASYTAVGERVIYCVKVNLMCHVILNLCVCVCVSENTKDAKWNKMFR